MISLLQLGAINLVAMVVHFFLLPYHYFFCVGGGGRRRAKKREKRGVRAGSLFLIALQVASNDKAE
jgi:hypothetical protein